MATTQHCKHVAEAYKRIDKLRGKVPLEEMEAMLHAEFPNTTGPVDEAAVPLLQAAQQIVCVPGMSRSALQNAYIESIYNLGDKMHSCVASEAGEVTCTHESNPQAVLRKRWRSVTVNEHEAPAAVNETLSYKASQTPTLKNILESYRMPELTAFYCGFVDTFLDKYFDKFLVERKYSQQARAMIILGLKSLFKSLALSPESIVEDFVAKKVMEGVLKMYPEAQGEGVLSRSDVEWLVNHLITGTSAVLDSRKTYTFLQRYMRIATATGASLLGEQAALYAIREILPKFKDDEPKKTVAPYRPHAGKVR